MSFGIRIQNGNEEVLIDNSFPNYVSSASSTLDSSVSWVTSGRTGTFTYYSFHVSSIVGDHSSPKMVLFKMRKNSILTGWQLPGQLVNNAGALARNSGSWTSGYYVTILGHSTVEYIVVDLAKNVPNTADFGIEVRDSEGNIVWHQGGNLLPNFVRYVNLHKDLTGEILTPDTILASGLSDGDLWVAPNYIVPGPFSPFLETPALYMKRGIYRTSDGTKLKVVQHAVTQGQYSTGGNNWPATPGTYLLLQ